MQYYSIYYVHDDCFFHLPLVPLNNSEFDPNPFSNTAYQHRVSNNSQIHYPYEKPIYK